MKKHIKAIGMIVCGVLIGYILFHSADPNAKLEYGDTGYPKNCRAIIKENIDSYYASEYSAEEVLDSIERNCGEHGYSWEDYDPEKDGIDL